MHAEICRAISHPLRLEILHLLRTGERSVSELAESMEVSPANASQQLRTLREAGVIRRRREGTTAYYSVANLKILTAYDLMTEVMEEHIASRSEALGKKKPKQTR